MDSRTALLTAKTKLLVGVLFFSGVGAGCSVSNAGLGDSPGATDSTGAPPKLDAAATNSSGDAATKFVATNTAVESAVADAAPGASSFPVSSGDAADNWNSATRKVRKDAGSSDGQPIPDAGTRDASPSDLAAAVDVAARDVAVSDVASSTDMGTKDAASPVDVGSSAPAPIPSPIPPPIFGVTLDDLSNLSGIQDSLASLARKPTARIVFDYPQPSSDYSAAVSSLHSVSYIMGQPLDSYYLMHKNCTTDLNLSARLADYFGNSTLLRNVDVWEIGNEVNGEWLCSGNTSNAYATVRQTYDQAKAKGKPTALTLFWYDLSCAPSAKYEMFNWINQNVEQDMRQGLDYVLISVYETACPAPSSWGPIFDKLGQLFPNSRLGFGETGTEDQSAPLSTKLSILDKYYGLTPPHPRFVGGDFWWYFAEDMVPKSSTLWGELNKYALSWTSLFP